MVGVGRVAAAAHFGVDLRAACLRALVFLEHQDAGPFAEHEPVAVLVEGPAGVGRVVVAFGESTAGDEAAEAQSA